MFTGLIETIGTIAEVVPLSKAKRFRIEPKDLLDDLKPDDSISVNGVCLTVEKLTGSGFESAAVDETLRRTTLGGLRRGDRVHLERAVRLSDRLGGHLVQGHVDEIGVVRSLESGGESRLLTIGLSRQAMWYVVEKGSISVDGVSLTVASMGPRECRLALIPHTLNRTLLGGLRPGRKVNIETDMIARYVERLMNTAPVMRPENPDHIEYA
jgi:riboflavin synthase